MNKQLKHGVRVKIVGLDTVTARNNNILKYWSDEGRDFPIETNVFVCDNMFLVFDGWNINHFKYIILPD